MDSNASTLYLGIDIGGTKSAAVVGDGDGRIFTRAVAPTPRDTWGDALELFVELAQAACREYGCRPSDCRAAGVSFGGPWDSRRELTRTPPNLPAWDGIPLRRLLSERLAVDTAVENDANATALAEHRWGAGRGCADMAYLTMGTGIGAGLILGRQLYRGRRDLAGEVGHTVMIPDGPLCPCGKRGCLEALASGTAIGRMGRERLSVGDGADVNAAVVCARAREGDRIAGEILLEAANWMGIGIANLLHTLNLERIVLGTLAVSAGDLFLEPIRASVRRHSWPDIAVDVDIVPAALGEQVQDLAALAVAVRVFPSTSL